MNIMIIYKHLTGREVLLFVTGGFTVSCVPLIFFQVNVCNGEFLCSGRGSKNTLDIGRSGVL